MAIEIYRHKRRKPFIPDETSFTRENYQIIGWNDDSHKFDTTPQYSVGTEITNGFSKNIDLYACWGKVSYYIYFFNDNPNLIRTNYIPTDSDNDFFAIGTSDRDFLCHEKQSDINYIEYPQTTDYTVLPSPETIGLEIPSGHVLDKWIDNKGNEYNIGDRIYNNNFDKILYAKLKLKLNVHFDSNGGIPASYDREVIIGDKLGELPNPEKQYYSISCWTDNIGNIITQDTIINNSLTCTCQWMKYNDIVANIDHDGNGKAIVSVTDPSSGYTVYYRTSTTGTWERGSSYQASSSTTVYFKIEAERYIPKGEDNTFGMNITKSTSGGFVVTSTFSNLKFDYIKTPEEMGFTYGYNSSEKWYTSYEPYGVCGGSGYVIMTGGYSTYQSDAIVTWSSSMI